MPKAVRGTLLIIAAVFGVLQISLLVSYFRLGSFSHDGTPVSYKISWLLVLPAAVLGVVAALPVGSVGKSRLFSAIAAGLTLLSLSIVPIFLAIRNLRIGSDPDEAFRYFRLDMAYNFSVWSKEFFLYPWHKRVEIAGLIALVLWIICAAFPAKKGSAGMHGAHAAGMPNAFGDPNATPITSMTSYAPAPVSSAPVVPATSQGAKFCTNCGKPLVGTAKFCAECGTPV
jgi:hypothetical protein